MGYMRFRGEPPPHWLPDGVLLTMGAGCPTPLILLHPYQNAQLVFPSTPLAGSLSCHLGRHLWRQGARLREQTDAQSLSA